MHLDATKVAWFVNGLIVGVLGLFLYQQIAAAVYHPAAPTQQAQTPPTVVYQQPATVISKSLGDQLAEGGAYAPRP
jgi:hypothetical protein